ncbi:androgen-dependent TFPI-regulating protein-like isoform X2 [Colias croceus]|uniref:androgen-dependent TFPI-regulating protein-like isoform X2 n=1 Tax=Colias crocea TaxID=72248 RepID=UPI001E27F4E5|nr:androgen-dependent TFPI-regulating protein-like isoform X2 [Colias croceus]
MADIETGLPSASSGKKCSIYLFVRTVYHLLYFLGHNAVLCWAMYIWYKIGDASTKHPVIQNLKYLAPAFFTNWNFSFQTFFLGLSLLYDLLEWFDKQNSNVAVKIKYWRDVLFCSAVVPFTLFVTSMFWSVYAIDRELVFPTIYDEVVPWWFNHCVHTNIVVVLVLETLLQARRKPTDEKVEQTIYWGVAFAYAVVYYTIYFATHRWLYQVFGVMTWWQVCIYQIFIWGISYVFYKLQFPINRLVHGQETEENVEQEKDNVEQKETNVEEKIKDNDTGKVITDLKTPPFSTRSWSLKFRSLRNQFETSRL